MEEKKQKEQEQPKKLSYDELSHAASDLSMQYQKAVQYIQKLQDELDRLQFNRTAFLLESLFKVMDHPEMYDNDFVDWTKGNIQDAVKTFYEESIADVKEEKPVTDAS